MTITEDKNICRDYYDNTNPSGDDRFLFTEALEFLIRETGNPDYMNDLGAFYYAGREFDLALKYYELAAESGSLYAISNLGYIWYYGRTGEKNYEKAFHYFDKARKMGDLTSAYKVADMYRNGYYVEKDPTKYRSLIEELYPKIRNARMLDDPLPEIYTRLARIRSAEGKTEEALELYDTARDFLAQRIRVNPFFGNLTIMRGLVLDTYKLRAFDPGQMDLYDLYYLLNTPHIITFLSEEALHEVESVSEDGGISIRFDDHWYRTIDRETMLASLDQEMAVYYTELDRLQKEHDRCREAGISTSYEVKRSKGLYRRLAKLLHPDINPDTDRQEVLRDLWQRVVTAYGHNDVKRLSELEVLIRRALKELGQGEIKIDIPDIDWKISELVSTINKRGLSEMLEPLIREIHLFDSYVAGTSHLADPSVLTQSKAGDRLTLRREDNKFDEHAILILTQDGKKLGYVPEKDNLVFSRLMDAGKQLIAKIRNIEKKGSFTQISIGIYLVDF